MTKIAVKYVTILITYQEGYTNNDICFILNHYMIFSCAFSLL